MSEDLTLHYKKMGISVTYLHSGIVALERIDILNELRTGKIDVLIGINLLREGLDLPEVKLVAIMDADKEGFLRSKTSLIQTVGRAARNAESQVIFYAEKITHSMDQTIKETLRRRRIQDEYNKEHGITPETITKMIPKSLKALHGFLDELDRGGDKISVLIKKYQVKSPREIKKLITKKHTEMKKVAAKLQFEKAVTLREELKELRFLEMSLLEGDNT
jgi:excinuclease ABC subunit B